MNKFRIVVGACDLLAGIMNLMCGEVVLGIAMLLVGFYLLFVEWE